MQPLSYFVQLAQISWYDMIVYIFNNKNCVQDTKLAKTKKNIPVGHVWN